MNWLYCPKCGWIKIKCEHLPTDNLEVKGGTV